MINQAVFLSLGAFAAATTVRKSTPVMGWNSYNFYNCNPSEAIMKQNAQGLVTQGLDELGYVYVTTDCGWGATSRSTAGELQWNSATFPSGGKALGEFIHGLGLKFGVYSGGGYYQCGSTNQPASLSMLCDVHAFSQFHTNQEPDNEDIDAKSFASWGADSLKYAL
jgi:alpha-galactosidase